MRVIIASAWTGFVLGFMVMSSRAEGRSLESALAGGAIVALVAATIGAVWAWAVTG